MTTTAFLVERRRKMRKSMRSIGLGLLAVTFAGVGAQAQTADLRASLTSSSFRVGEVGIYRLTVRNQSNEPATGPIRVSSSLPAGLSFLDATGPGWVCNGQGDHFACLGDGLGAADSTALTIRVYVCTAAFPTVTAMFRVSYPHDPDPSNNDAIRASAVKDGECSGPPATPTSPRPRATTTPTPTPTPPLGVDLALSASSSREFLVGSRATYRFRVTNLGATASADTIVFVDTLPDGLTFVSASGDRWSCEAEGQLVTCERFRSLAPGARTGISIQVAVGANAYPQVVNHAAVFFAGDDDARNNSQEQTTLVRKRQRPLPRPKPER